MFRHGKLSMTMWTGLVAALCAMGFAQQACAQTPLWTGVLAPSRAIDWSATSPGVVGGIPSATWPKCVTAACVAMSTAGSSATAVLVNAAIASAPAKSYVALGAGTYTLSAGINMKSNVVLRGAGPDQTFLVFTGTTSCGGLWAQVCFSDAAHVWTGSVQAAGGGSNSAGVCGTGTGTTCSNQYTSGETHLQLTNVGSAGIVNGQNIYLDQNDDAPTNPSVSNKTGLLVCDVTSTTDGCSLQAGAPGRTSVSAGGIASGTSVDRNLFQIVQVVSGCAEVCKGEGPFNVTITPGIYGAKWSAAQNPGVWWSSNGMMNAGVEALSVDSTLVGDNSKSGISFFNAYNCWVSNVRSLRPNRNHVWFYQSAHITVSNSYFYGTQNAESQSYGVETHLSSDDLVVNNISHQVTTPFMLGPTTGTVYAYNFSVNDYYYKPDWLMSAFDYRHDAGVLYNLSEGNITAGFQEDVFHGTGGANTAFRNYAVGWESGKLGGTGAIVLYSYNRMENFIGNVIGCNNTTSSYPGNCGAPFQKYYQTGAGVGVVQSIFDLGAGDNDAGEMVLADPYVATSLMRWGNYDVVNKTVRWVSSEVPSGLTDGYANPVPLSENLPSSFWLKKKPSWWGSASPWPGIGPDISGGSVPGVGGHADLNPAALCYLTKMNGPVTGTGDPLTFNASGCYGVQPPIHVKAVVN